MRWIRNGGPFAVAGALVAAIALAGWQGEAEAAKTPSDEKPIVQKRAPTFELVANSMDVFGRSQNVSCFDYKCDGLANRIYGPLSDGYVLVRIIHTGGAFPSPCDETFLGIDGNALKSRLVFTRWFRLMGPSRTPVGCFTGRLSIAVRFTDAAEDVELARFFLRGTSGLRPSQADPDVNPGGAAGSDRCEDPTHDEGCYTGRFGKKALARLIQQQSKLDLSPKDIKRAAKALSRCVISGTFEGTWFPAVMGDPCTIEDGQWWFDGLMKCRCKPTEIRPHTDTR